MKRRIALVVLVLLVAAAIWFGPRVRAMTYVGAGYVAKQMCSCLFVAERSFDSCRSDMLPSMDRIGAELLSDGEGVRAWVPLLAERVARHTRGRGCTLFP